MIQDVPENEIQDFHGKSSVRQEEYSLHQQIGLKI